MGMTTEQEDKILQRLKKAREDAKLSQLELSYKSGVSQNMITYIETGKSSPTLSTLLKLCNALSINPSILFEEESEEREKNKQQILDMIKRL